MRAKLKVMLDKTSDKLNKEPNSEERSVVVFAPPSAADIARIEGDSFEPARFVSHRAAKKVERERETISINFMYAYHSHRMSNLEWVELRNSLM